MTAGTSKLPAGFLTVFTNAVRQAIAPRLTEWGVPGLVSDVSLEQPASHEHGDLSLSVAMAAAGQAQRPPRDLALELVSDMEKDARVAGLCTSIQIAGPGFINFYISDAALAEAAIDSLNTGEDFGSASLPDPQSILLEFVSANPTGPLHVGHARYAAYGDSLARILQFAGYKVTTEFYINDYGTQMELFGRSLAAAYARRLGAEATVPEDGYRGEYIERIAGEIETETGDNMLEHMTPEPDEAALSYFREHGCSLMLKEIRAILDRFRVGFDCWYSEASLYRDKTLEPLVEKLRSSGEVIEKDGATWLKTSRYGDDKDRVLIRGTGEPTYFASDIAYHQDKLLRGYDHLINIWGADHHGYVPRMKAAFEALSHDPEKLEIIIGQLVSVLEGGEKRQMSKRAGTMVTLQELLDSIGVDAARFYLVDRSHDSTLDLDLEKARLKSEENPVYYVQYAHARISSILRRAKEEGLDYKIGMSSTHLPTMLETQERELVMKLLFFPYNVQAAALSREPHRLTVYARELAAVFHVFYHNCPVIRAEGATAAFRFSLCRLTRYVISKTLSLVGVAAPEKM